MNQTEFEHNMMGAKAMMETNPDYWTGYQRGLRKLYHSENFGTIEEHELWLSLVNEDDDQRHHRGIGYNAGYNGMTISDAIKQTEVIK